MRLRLHSAGSTIPRLWPTGSSGGVAPLDYDPVVLRKPFRPHLAVGALPSGVLQEDGFRSPLAVAGFRLCARIGFSIPASLSGR